MLGVREAARRVIACLGNPRQRSSVAADGGWEAFMLWMLLSSACWRNATHGQLDHGILALL